MDLKKQLFHTEAALKAAKERIAALEKSEAQLNSILDCLSEPVERSLPDNTLTYVNKTFCDFYQVKREDVLHTDTMRLVYDQDREKIADILRYLSPEQPSYHYLCRALRSDGKVIWAEFFGHAFFDENGKVLEYQDVCRDITGYKEAVDLAEFVQDGLEEQIQRRTLELNKVNQRLERANDYLRSTLNCISECVVSFDCNDGIHILNYGKDPVWSVIENQIAAYIRGQRQKKDSCFYQLLKEKKNFEDIEIVFERPEEEIHCLASGVAFADDQGNPYGLLILRTVAEVSRLISKISGNQAKVRFSDIIGESGRMKELIGIAKKIAGHDGTVIIEGESGTGKELFAQSIHNASPRRNGPFVAINCGSIPRDLIASELFGYVEGAFTGAKKGGKPGKFEIANGGTIFLDEIGDMPIEQQISLLRVIQERAVQRVGGEKLIPVDVRIICATNKNLYQEIVSGSFRQDLYYRLNVITLEIPPLRSRKEDIPVLFDHFLQKLFHSEKYITVPEAVYRRLIEYDWPGNVRELQNITERTFFMCHGDTLTVEDLPKHIQGRREYLYQAAPLDENDAPLTLADQRKEGKRRKEEAEKIEMQRLLAMSDGNVTAAASAMGISRTAFYRKLKKYSV